MRDVATNAGFFALSRLYYAIAAVSLVLILAAASLGQTSVGSSANSEQQRILELKKLELVLKSARSRLERAQKLHDAGLVPPSELEQAHVDYRHAEVSFQQAFLQLFADVPRLALAGGLKLQQPDGKRFVRLTVRNSSGVTLDYKAFGVDSADVPIPNELKLREITNIAISLREYVPTGNLGPIISHPYETVISALAVDQEKTLQFELLKDVDVVTVSMNYSGKTDNREIYLEKDASANIVTVTSASFSQEADLGAQAVFDLSLEQFTRVTNSFKLLMINLPAQINHEFVDPATNARLSQVRFPEGVTSLKLQLRLSLPEQAGDLVLDRPIAFWILVADPAVNLPSIALQGDKEIRAIRCGKVQLELIPRGVGKLEVSAPMLYHEIRPGENALLSLTVKNTGTRMIRNVKVSAENPVNWRTEISPALIPVLEPNREEMVKAIIQPPHDIGIGDFEVRLRTEANDGSRRVRSEDKIERVHIASSAGIMSVVWLGGIVAIVVGGVVFFAKSLARR